MNKKIVNIQTGEVQVVPLTPEEIAEREALANQPPPVLSSVTMRQCRLELLARGLLDAVETAMATLPQEAQIEWEYATQVNRNSGFVAQMATLLEFSEADTDAFFLEASQR